jgi:hypothetical protein
MDQSKEPEIKAVRYLVDESGGREISFKGDRTFSGKGLAYGGSEEVLSGADKVAP